jgi:allophanate hydrolase subunit 2
MSIEIVGRGVATSVRDGGRTGLAHLGRSRGGAVDLASLELGNRLLGNPEHAAGFETSGGLVLRCDSAVMVAVTGSPVDLDVTGGPPVGWGAPMVLPAGAVLRIGRLRGGARTYVCVRGGVVGVSGDTVHLGSDPMEPAASHPAVPRPLDAAVRLWLGPRVDWFEETAWDALLSEQWEVLPASDRVGVRLHGEPLVRTNHAELPSEGLVEGAIQVPPDGQPIVMLADHPTTGGYPVIAVVDVADLWLVAQRGAGGRLRFTRAQ